VNSEAIPDTFVKREELSSTAAARHSLVQSYRRTTKQSEIDSFSINDSSNLPHHPPVVIDYTGALITGCAVAAALL